VTNEVRKLDGVVGVDVDLAAGTVEITSDSALDEAEVAAAIDEAGYEVRP
jgi:copper chaperone CopZ